MKKTFQFDTILAGAVLFLLIFGLIMITSIGVPKSIDLSAPNVLYPTCSDPDVDCYFLFKKHLNRLFIGIVAFYIALKLPIKFWGKLSKFVYFFAVGLLFFVFTMGESHSTIATSWLTLFNTSIQPSEFAKVGLILYLSYWFSKRLADVGSFKEGFIPFTIISGLIVFPVILQNDFGTAMVLGLICLAIYLAAGARISHVGFGIMVAMLGAIIVVATVPHVTTRFSSFLRVDDTCIENACWQSQQANIAVGSGGFWGKGLTQGVQKSYWLPQASDDFIFAASAEELGFIRILWVVIAYFVISYRGYLIASRAESKFESFLAYGITTWIAFQAFINIAVNIALLPVTGITLPFVSYGGSSLVASLIGVGILLNISKNTIYYAGNTNRRGNRRSYNPKPVRYRRA